MRARAAHAAGTLAVTLVLLGSCAAHALDPEKALTQYAIRNWQSRNGLPQNSVQAIVQTRDGYIWLGTQEGLVRFDGVQFTVFDRNTAPALGNNFIYALHEDSAGALWIGTNGGGITRLREGKFQTFTTRDGLSDDTVLAIGEDQERTLWIGTGRGVTRHSAGRFEVFAGDPLLAGQRVMAVLPVRDGSLWFGTYSDGLAHWDKGRLDRVTTRQGLSHDTIWSLHEDRRGVLWAGTLGGGLNRIENGRITSFHARDGLGSENVFGILEDRRGTLWLATDGAGLVRYAQGRFESLSHAKGLVNDTTWPLLEDRDGSLWVGTLGGLSQLRDTPFKLLGVAEGMPEQVILSVSEDAAGVLWAASNTKGLARLQNGKASYYTKKNGLPHDSVRSVYPDRAGNVWAGTIAGLARIGPGGVRTFGRLDGLSSEKIASIHQDAQGTMWIGTFGGGLNKLLPTGRFESFTSRAGLPNDRVIAIADRKAGGLWLATDGGGLSAFQEGRFTNFGKNEGLTDLHLEALHEDRDGTLWVAGAGGGLHRLREGRFFSFTTQKGLLDDLGHSILDDGAGHLWLSSNRGLQRISREDLEEVGAGRRARLTPRMFGEDEGMRSREFNGNSQPAGWRGSDGTLWFAGMEGIVGVDLARIAPVAAPAAVHIEKAMTQGGQSLDEAMRVGPDLRSVEFRYTALHYINPELLRFRYRLAGFDKEWVDAGARRAAFYTNLPPGQYRFEVSATLPGGPWTAVPAVLSFELLPHFHETWWFRTAAVLALAVMLVLANLVLVRRYRRRSQLLAGLVRERQRAEAEVRQINAELEKRVAARTAELEAANKALESFNYTVSHDLRGPLLSVDGFAASLLATHGDRLDERGKAMLERIRTAGQRMSDLITDMLRLASVSRQQPERAEVNLSQMANRIAEGLRLRDPERNVSWEIQGGLLAFADASLLEVAFDNLLGNAWKYTGKTCEALIRVGAVEENGATNYFVADNGAGFDMAHAAKLFDVFQRLHATEDFPGTGIGLAIVARIIHAHGGTIRAQAAPGQGAAFFFTIPHPDA